MENENSLDIKDIIKQELHNAGLKFEIILRISYNDWMYLIGIQHPINIIEVRRTQLNGNKYEFLYEILNKEDLMLAIDQVVVPIHVIKQSIEIAEQFYKA